jgi:hypothetical protein
MIRREFEMDAVPITTIVSVVGGVVGLVALSVAWTQMRIASAKVRLDLYNKRFNVYLSALAYHQAVWGKEDFKASASEFIKCYRESKFLFAKEDGIYDTLTIIKNCGGVIGVNQELAEDGRNLTESNSYAHHEKCVDARQEMTSALSKLEDQLAKYIDFKVVRGWSVF